MKRIRNTIAFCMVLLLLLVFAGCAEPTPSSSVPPSSSQASEQSSEVSRPEIEPYIIEPLETPMNGAMTYEEYFSVERAVKPSGYGRKDLNGEIHHVYRTDRFWGKMGLVYHTDHEIYWLGDNGEEILIYRTPKKIQSTIVYEDIMIWEEYTCKKIDGIEIYDRTMYRFYIPQFRNELWASVYDGALSIIDIPGGVSTTDIKIIQTVSREKHEQGGYVECIERYVYSDLTDKKYKIENAIWDEDVRNEYLHLRNQNIIKES